jgi:hypothetical protein
MADFFAFLTQGKQRFVQALVRVWKIAKECRGTIDLFCRGDDFTARNLFFLSQCGLHGYQKTQNFMHR